MKNIIRVCILVIISIAPSIGRACSVCGGALTKDKEEAYLIITAFLASLPVIMFCILGIWIYRNYRNSGKRLYTPLSK